MGEMTTHFLVAMFRKIVSVISGTGVVQNQGVLTPEAETSEEPVRENDRKRIYGVPSFLKRTPLSSAFSWRSLFGPRLWQAIIVLLILSLPLALFSKTLIFVSLHGIAALSRVYYRWIPVSLGVELGTFVIVLTAVSHGPVAGVTIGMCHYIVSRTITKEPWSIAPACLLGYVVMGFLAAALPLSAFPSFVLFGLAMTLAYNLTASPIFVVFLGYSAWREAFFVVTNLLFNYWVFSTFGEWGLKLVGAA